SPARGIDERRTLGEQGAAGTRRLANGLNAPGEARMRRLAFDLRIPAAWYVRKCVQLGQRPNQRIGIPGEGHRTEVALGLALLTMARTKRERDDHGGRPQHEPLA